jgi:hypothetical protein
VGSRERRGSWGPTYPKVISKPVISDDVPGFVLWTSELITDTLITDYFRATPIGARITFRFSPRARAALASVSCPRQRQRM